MSNNNTSIDYKGFKGAGSHNAPPPQKPNTNPTRIRLLLLLLAPILMSIVMIIFGPLFIIADSLLSRELKVVNDLVAKQDIRKQELSVLESRLSRLESQKTQKTPI